MDENSEIAFSNLSSHQLIAHWRTGSHEAARVLMDRYRLRLIALIASRLGSRQRTAIDPEDVVQSAMGSFFRNTACNAVSRLQIDSTLTAWNLLAMFARRKLSRSLERMMAAKRGAFIEHAVTNEFEPIDFVQSDSDEQDVAEIVSDLNAMLAPDQRELLELMLAGNTQREIAESLSIDERTVRRRITNIRNLLGPHLIESPISNEDKMPLLARDYSLPCISYGQFVLGRMIGCGGFGKVYRARMQASDEMVAVKFMHRHFWTDDRAKASFLQEIDQASRINHPGIIKYLGWGESPHGGPYILSAIIDGQPLSHLRAMGDIQMVQVLRQVCEAIHVAHESGVVHGDLTPNNILITPTGQAIITDFGLSTCLQPIAPSPSVAPSIHTVGGTLGYAAPEQISNSFGSIGPWTDIYAIGAIAYFCLTGFAPHAKDDIETSLTSTISEDDEIVPVDAPMTPASKTLCMLVKLALRKIVTDRPHDISTLMAALNDLS